MQKSVLANETVELKRRIKRLDEPIVAHDIRVLAFEVSSELIIASRRTLKVAAI